MESLQILQRQQNPFLSAPMAPYPSSVTCYQHQHELRYLNWGKAESWIHIFWISPWKIIERQQTADCQEEFNRSSTGGSVAARQEPLLTRSHFPPMAAKMLLLFLLYQSTVCLPWYEITLQSATAVTVFTSTEAWGVLHLPLVPPRAQTCFVLSLPYTWLSVWGCTQVLKSAKHLADPVK